MKPPKVLVRVEGGAVIDASSNVPELFVRIFDEDALQSGENHITDLGAEYIGADAGPLTEGELERFYKEMESNHDGNITTVELLLHIIGDVPLAALALREWLEDAEQATRELENGPWKYPEPTKGGANENPA